MKIKELQSQIIIYLHKRVCYNSINYENYSSSSSNINEDNDNKNNNMNHNIKLRGRKNNFCGNRK